MKPIFFKAAILALLYQMLPGTCLFPSLKLHLQTPRIDDDAYLIMLDRHNKSSWTAVRALAVAQRTDSEDGCVEFRCCGLHAQNPDQEGRAAK